MITLKNWLHNSFFAMAFNAMLTATASYNPVYCLSLYPYKPNYIIMHYRACPQTVGCNLAVHKGDCKVLFLFRNRFPRFYTHWIGWEASHSLSSDTEVEWGCRQDYSLHCSPFPLKSSPQCESLYYQIQSSRKRGMGPCHNKVSCDPRITLPEDIGSGHRPCSCGRQSQRTRWFLCGRSHFQEGVSEGIYPWKRTQKLSFSTTKIMHCIIELKGLQDVSLSTWQTCETWDRIHTNRCKARKSTPRINKTSLL